MHYTYRGDDNESVPKGVTKVTFHPSVKHICDDAFAYCDLIKSIVIPNTITSIGRNAFYSCSKLKSAKLSNNLERIHHSAFSNCVCLSSIKIPAGMKVIDEYTFCNCKSLKTVSLPETIEKIMKRAFANCSHLEKVHFPKSLKYVDKFAFKSCDKLVQGGVKLPQTVTNYPGCLLAGLNNTNHIFLQDGPGAKLEFQGMTQRGYGPEKCGITLQQLQELRQHPLINSDTTMREVVELVIKPATKSWGIGYALLVNQNEPMLKSKS